VPTSSGAHASVKRNFPLYSISVYRHPPYSAPNVNKHGAISVFSCNKNFTLWDSFRACNVKTENWGSDSEQMFRAILPHLPCGVFVFTSRDYYIESFSTCWVLTVFWKKNFEVTKRNQILVQKKAPTFYIVSTCERFFGTLFVHMLGAHCTTNCALWLNADVVALLRSSHTRISKGRSLRKKDLSA